MLVWSNSNATIPFDVIGLSEVERQGRHSVTLQQSGHCLFHSGQVGFLVNKRWTSCSTFRVITSRVAILDVQTPAGTSWNKFSKPLTRKWSWISPYIEMKNAINYILSQKPNIFTDGDILAAFNSTLTTVLCSESWQ